ncbi:hypothetical protein DFH29DRAFT_173567 [Suillus ampliporus]|nr:hypothetical protein DFH29DRAFT_173567 [Suillus ampliporus]
MCTSKMHPIALNCDIAVALLSSRIGLIVLTAGAYGRCLRPVLTAGAYGRCLRPISVVNGWPHEYCLMRSLIFTLLLYADFFFVLHQRRELEKKVRRFTQLISNPRGSLFHNRSTPFHRKAVDIVRSHKGTLCRHENSP